MIKTTKPILVTGAAGFIGYHLCQKLLRAKHQVVGLDNLNAYYDVTLKESRLSALRADDGFSFVRCGLEDRAAVERVFKDYAFEVVVHLGAQAGVRHSLNAPHDYIDSNLVGFMNILEGCRHFDARHLVYASSSSVYGGNTRMPFKVSDNVDHPKSLYAATKKSNELMAHSYSALFGLPTTGLRFFTVYGPSYRPDMALFLFMDAMTEGRPIRVFNHGNMYRDFTYIDDITESMMRLIFKPATPLPEFDTDNPDPAGSWAHARIFNIGNRHKEHLMDVIRLLEEASGLKAEKEFLPMQPGDVEATWADTATLERWTGYRPKVSIREGIPQFVAWYQAYRNGR